MRIVAVARCVWIALLTIPMLATAATIHVEPRDSFSKMEAARAGDEVVLAPGTYDFRVYLTNKASADRPIVIRAKDPSNPPVWDFGNVLVEDAPGSYKGGDRGRGAWQFNGAAHYKVSGVVFRNCRNKAKNAAGIRYFNGSRDIRIVDCTFAFNDNGLTGGTQRSEATVESCEFDRNGNREAKSATHNVYILGGTFTMRFCYVHDAVQGQNFHIRAKDSTIEYNWFARARAYEGDLMTDDDYKDKGPYAQQMLLRGNVFVQKTNALNKAQIVVLFNDYWKPNLSMSVRVIGNTLVGNGGSAALVRLSNDQRDTKMSAEVSNNIIYGTRAPIRINKPTIAVVTGKNNWLRKGVKPGRLENSIFSTTPGFKDAAAGDYTLSDESVCIGAAAQVPDAPMLEYFQNEKITRQFRSRVTARDIGAFESTTSGPGLNPVGRAVRSPSR